jgi:succinate dehydrogenase hydrophobic anchor subunit
VAAAERGRTWLTAGILGIAGLGRETNLLAAVALPWPRGWRGWARAAAAGALIVLPLVIWQDYIWSIYRGTSVTEGAGQITVPFSAYLMKWRETVRNPAGVDRVTMAQQMLVIVALSVQAVYVVWTRKWTAPWWRLAAAFAVLLVTVHWAVWEGYPGAVTRVVLPLKFGFNALLASDQPRGFWAWLVFGNLDLTMSAGVLPLI